MVAKFFICERKVSNLIYYSHVLLITMVYNKMLNKRPVSTGWLQTIGVNNNVNNFFMCKRIVINFSCIQI